VGTRVLSQSVLDDVIEKRGMKWTHIKPGRKVLVSLLIIEEGIFEVNATAGDTHLARKILTT
jgi:hypothetical protein